VCRRARPPLTAGDCTLPAAALVGRPGRNLVTSSLPFVSHSSSHTLVIRKRTAMLRPCPCPDPSAFRARALSLSHWPVARPGRLSSLHVQTQPATATARPAAASPLPPLATAGLPPARPCRVDHSISRPPHPHPQRDLRFPDFLPRAAATRNGPSPIDRTRSLSLYLSLDFVSPRNATRRERDRQQVLGSSRIKRPRAREMISRPGVRPAAWVLERSIQHHAPPPPVPPQAATAPLALGVAQHTRPCRPRSLARSLRTRQAVTHPLLSSSWSSSPFLVPPPRTTRRVIPRDVCLQWTRARGYE
jgi:hypothetical protein